MYFTAVREHPRSRCRSNPQRHQEINIATDVLIAVANSFEDMKQKPDFKYNTGMFVNSQACAREFIKGKMREFALMD